ncbi:hypothetical protein LCGC14_0387520 [marine sediment metagenome]|uniref:Uncharacterized protein n=1 Tax=marine sediment metagenome TaxID=412755 RepID=A0A0F9T0G2_9ZZZZ
MYRLEGWSERWKQTVDKNTEYIRQGNASGVMFEAGADAMLEGLKKEALTPYDISKPLPTDPAMFVFSIPDRAGFLVFIPEEE